MAKGKTEPKSTYDVIIVGAGAAGLTAAIYTRRKLLSTLIISVDIGGQNLLTEDEENYPGYTGLSGSKLMQTMDEQATRFGAELVMGRAERLDKLGEDHYKVTLSNGESYDGRTVILAIGKIPKKMGLPGEDKFVGRGIHTCETCDAPMMRGKVVAVVGGGNPAAEAAELLTKFSSKIYLIHNEDRLSADDEIVNKLKRAKNVEMIFGSTPAEIKGKEKVNGLVVENITTKSKRELDLDSIFIEIGYEKNTGWVKHLVKLNGSGEIITNDYAETSHPGIFAAGEVTSKPYKQTATATGEGACADLSAYNYLMRKEGKPTVKQDWT